MTDTRMDAWRASGRDLNGTDLVTELCGRLGGQPGVASEAATKLAAAHAGRRIANHAHGFFTAEDEGGVIAQITPPAPLCCSSGWQQRDPETHPIVRAMTASQGHTPDFTVQGGDFDTPDRTAICDHVHDAARARRGLGPHHALGLRQIVRSAWNWHPNAHPRPVVPTGGAGSGRQRA